MKLWILLLFLAVLLGCSDEPVRIKTVESVHLAGIIYKSNMDGDNVASYWKDGVYTSLTGGDIQSTVSSLWLDGSSVVMGGRKYNVNEPSISVTWRNGTEAVIDKAFSAPIVASRNGNLVGVWLEAEGWVFHRNGVTEPILDTAYSYGPLAMTFRDDDMYISGYGSGTPHPPTYSPPQHAQYWKNGKLIFREPEASNGLSIFAYGDDIYMAGILYPAGGTTSIACYWKNGNRVDLTDGNGVAVARSIFVTDEHVYLAGMIDDKAVYWKDGVVTFLTDEDPQSMANSIFVREPDVHVAGHQHGYPAYWKNGIRQEIENQDKRGKVLFVAVGSN